MASNNETINLQALSPGAPSIRTVPYRHPESRIPVAITRGITHSPSNWPFPKQGNAPAQ